MRSHLRRSDTPFRFSYELQRLCIGDRAFVSRVPISRRQQAMLVAVFDEELPDRTHLGERVVPDRHRDDGTAGSLVQAVLRVGGLD